MQIRSKFNPLSWSERTVKIVFAIGLLIFLIIYIIVGLQPAAASDTVPSSQLQIPEIKLTSAVEPVSIENNELKAPDTTVGSISIHQNKTLLIGHSSTIFTDLHLVQPNDIIAYKDKSYRIVKTETLLKENIYMHEILSAADVETIVLMTCAGEPLSKTDYTHRFIVTAEVITN